MTNLYAVAFYTEATQIELSRLDIVLQPAETHGAAEYLAKEEIVERINREAADEPDSEWCKQPYVIIKSTTAILPYISSPFPDKP